MGIGIRSRKGRYGVQNDLVLVITGIHSGHDFLAKKLALLPSSGQVEGFVFTKGHSGTGYYSDERRLRSGVGPARLSLAELIASAAAIFIS